MKVLKLITLIFLCSTGFLNKIYAQDQDYVITKKNDTIFCTVSYPFYRVNKKDKFTKIDTNITEYFTGNNKANYVLKKIPNEKFGDYLRWLERGRINLYQRTVIAGSGSALYLYANKGNDPLVLIETPNAGIFGTRDDQKKALHDLLSDNPNLKKEIEESLKHRYILIKYYIKRYNMAYLDDNKPTK